MVPAVVVEAGAELDPLPPIDDAWLRALAAGIRLADHVVSGDGAESPLRRMHGGAWRIGEYVGDLWLAGRRLRIVAPGQLGTASPVAVQVAALWCEHFETATRHGPPALHADVPHSGPSLRGRLDVRGTVRLRGKGSSFVASVYRARNLDNDISRSIVAAERALTRQIGDDRWRTRRVAEIMPEIHQAVGRRPAVPTEADLARIRYSPITRPFKALAELSLRIVTQDPVVTTTEPGRPQGLLIPAAAV